MQIINIKLNLLKPYENNPRNNENAVEYVANSIKEFGFKVPIIIDKNNTIVCGHTRYLASKKLGLTEVPCVIADDLTPDKIQAFRLIDNKTNEFATWNEDLLLEELKAIENIDMTEYGFEEISEKMDEIDVDKYTQTLTSPQYEIKGEKPDISELVNTDKSNELEEEINNSSLSFKEKEFLINASKRHNVFDYGKIAEYYAHASEEMQNLMEKSALVIIDYNDAILNGYTTLSDKLRNLMEKDKKDDE